ncbi:hypothetical protein [Asaia astilbis]|uniref:hypothetical protein n=1 Tax=Asaia astilbis TaxID=610244 RepID=UPI000A41ECE3|nr:hypothetical protein [Asaia astilbis]
MPQLIQNGALNTAALPVPDLYVQIAQPETLLISGVSSALLGFIGTASWGPVDTPTIIGSVVQFRQIFAGKRAWSSNLNIAVDVAVHQGASQFCLVRVTDGNDVAAHATLGAAQLKARYTGTAGNALTVSVMSQSFRDGQFVLTVAHAELGTTTYGGANWTALQDALAADNQALIRIDLTGDATIAEAGSVQLSGGEDGAERHLTVLLASRRPRQGFTH